MPQLTMSLDTDRYPHHAVAWLVEEDEKHEVEHHDLDVQFDQSSQAIDGFSKVVGLGVQVHFFDFCVGPHHDEWTPERNREHSI